MKKFISEFKDFALKGNIFDLSIGVVIGNSFNKIVSSLVNDIIMPIIGLLTGGINFTEFKINLIDPIGSKTPLTINIGVFLQNVIDFLIIALSIFIAVKSVAKLEEKFNLQQKTSKKSDPDNIILLREIRDLLKSNNNNK